MKKPNKEDNNGNGKNSEEKYKNDNNEDSSNAKKCWNGRKQT